MLLNFVFGEIPIKRIPLHCVFHGIRFKVNKGWAQRSPFFMPFRMLVDYS